MIQNVKKIILFSKPALTQFPNEYRNDKESLQSYLVGSECIDQNCKIGNQNYDNGFALAKMAGTEWSTEGWSEIIPDFSQFKFQINNCTTAVAQGPICFISNWKSNYNFPYVFCVDDTFVFTSTKNGDLPKITVHHSSIRDDEE